MLETRVHRHAKSGTNGDVNLSWLSYENQRQPRTRKQELNRSDENIKKREISIRRHGMPKTCMAALL